jgi:hypothetical protein
MPTVPCAEIGTSAKYWDRPTFWDRKFLGQETGFVRKTTRKSTANLPNQMFFGTSEGTIHHLQQSLPLMTMLIHIRQFEGLEIHEKNIFGVFRVFMCQKLARWFSFCVGALHTTRRQNNLHKQAPNQSLRPPKNLGRPPPKNWDVPISAQGTVQLNVPTARHCKQPQHHATTTQNR